MNDNEKQQQTDQLADTRARATVDGRVNQKQRTRAALVEAASELVAEGATPTLADVADRALISKTTAYRYFASAEALIEEVFFDRAFPTVDAVLGTASDEPVARVLAVESAVNSTMLAHEKAMRIIVRNAIDMALQNAGDGHRRGRRQALIDAALEPLAGALDSETHSLLGNALALVIGPEAMLAALDVCRLSPDRAHDVSRWAAEALVRHALRSPDLAHDTPE